MTKLQFNSISYNLDVYSTDMDFICVYANDRYWYVLSTKLFDSIKD